MDILEFLLSVADDLTDAEFEDCDTYLDLFNDGPETMSHRDEEKYDDQI